MEPLANQIQEHLIGALEESEMLTVPFTHLAVDGVLPGARFSIMTSTLSCVDSSYQWRIKSWFSSKLPA